jgi:hypothetical protein
MGLKAEISSTPSSGCELFGSGCGSQTKKNVIVAVFCPPEYEGGITKKLDGYQLKSKQPSLSPLCRFRGTWLSAASARAKYGLTNNEVDQESPSRFTHFVSPP